jgi:hypothetical protein
MAEGWQGLKNPVNTCASGGFASVDRSSARTADQAAKGEAMEKTFARFLGAPLLPVSRTAD